MKVCTYLMAFSFLLLASCVQPYRSLKEMEFSDLQYPYLVKTVQLNDSVKVAYVDKGKGDQTIIFIHGLGSYLPAWQKNIAGLSNKYRCIALDLPGYGKSSKANFNIGMAFYADVIRQFMDKLGIASAHIAGHSMGGQIAITLALQHPQKVKRLILVSPAGLEKFSEGEKEWFRKVLTVDGIKLTPVQQIRKNVVLNFYNMPDDAEFMVTDRIALRGAAKFDWYCYAVVKSIQGMVNEPVYDYLPELSQATLIIFGENDNLIPNPYLHGGKTCDIAEMGHKIIPNSQLVMVPSCGHFVQFEKAGEFNKAIESFVEN